MLLTSLITSDGKALPAAQSVSRSIVGSPFSAPAGVSINTGEINCRGVLIATTDDVHIRVLDRGDTSPASSTDMPVFKNSKEVIPLESEQSISIVGASGILIPAKVYIEKIRGS